MLFRVLLFFCVVILTASCSNSKIEYCNQLKRMASDKTISKYLKVWVQENVEDKVISHSDVVRGGLKVPGRYFYPVNFNWDMLNFNSELSQVRLIGPKTSSFEGGHITDLKSVMFVEKSGYGILVKLNNVDDYGLSDVSLGFFSEISDGIGVLCLDLDK
ncbi:hypothetical protein Misp06_00265 [Microbulbifer sp. NBRC 101763]|uniref:hypothetical protein n=1 Tax=unclassified Microbulbifer TaxID=2619833 RepID=UPI0030AA3E6D